MKKSDTPKTVKTFKDMASQTEITGEREKPLSRDEFEASIDYVEKMCRETIERVKELEVWKSSVANAKTQDVVAKKSQQGAGRMTFKSNQPPIDAVSQRAPRKHSDTDEQHSASSDWDANMDSADVEDNDISEQFSPKKSGKGVSLSSRRIGRKSTPKKKRGVKGTLVKHLAKRKTSRRVTVREEAKMSDDDEVICIDDGGRKEAGNGVKKNEKTRATSRGRGREPTRNISKRRVSSPSTSRVQRERDERNRNTVRNVNTKPNDETPASSSNNSSSEDGYLPQRSNRQQEQTRRGGNKFRDGDEDLPPPTKRQNYSNRRQPDDKRYNEMPALKSTNGGSRDNRSNDGQGRSMKQERDKQSEYSSETSNESTSSEVSDSASYATVAAEDLWHLAKSKKRKRGKSEVMKIQLLRSAPTTVKRELYVQELDYSTCYCQEDLEDIVYYHCKTNGVIPIDLCTIPVRNSRAVAGCKVTVKEHDYYRTSQVEFWPEGCTVRDWKIRKNDPQNKN